MGVLYFCCGLFTNTHFHRTDDDQLAKSCLEIAQVPVIGGEQKSTVLWGLETSLFVGHSRKTVQ